MTLFFTRFTEFMSPIVHSRCLLLCFLIIFGTVLHGCGNKNLDTDYFATLMPYSISITKNGDVFLSCFKTTSDIYEPLVLSIFLADSTSGSEIQQQDFQIDSDYYQYLKYNSNIDSILLITGNIIPLDSAESGYRDQVVVNMVMASLDNNEIWSEAWHSYEYFYVNGVCFDQLNNTYIAGYNNEEIFYDNNNKINIDPDLRNQIAFLCQLDAYGKTVWSIPYNCISSDIICGNEDIYIYGRQITTTSRTGSDSETVEDNVCNIVRVNNESEITAMQNLECDGVELDITDMTILPNGLIISAINSSSYSTEILNGAGYNYLIHTDNNYNINYYITCGFNEGTIHDSVATSDNSIIIAGEFESNLAIAEECTGQPSISHGYYDSFIAKLSETGEVIWIRTWGGENSDRISQIAIDHNDNIYVLGSYQAYGDDIVDLNPGSGEYNLTDSHGAYVSKFNSDGEYLWSFVPVPE